MTRVAFKLVSRLWLRSLSFKRAAILERAQLFISGGGQRSFLLTKLTSVFFGVTVLQNKNYGRVLPCLPPSTHLSILKVAALA